MISGESPASWGSRLAAAMWGSDSLLCVGLDPDPVRMPAGLGSGSVGSAIESFNAGIIAATHDLVCAYKPNLGFYLAHGVEGLRALERTRMMIPSRIPVILDAKIGDVSSTSAAYARGVFDSLGFDAVTVSPYLGRDALEPFLDRAGVGVFVLCRTSNPGSGELQGRRLAGGKLLYQHVAENVQTWSEDVAATVGLVVGATYPEELGTVRGICPNAPILLPGVGAQAGDLQASVANGVAVDGERLLVSASRAVLYAGGDDDWETAAHDAAVRLRDAINDARWPMAAAGEPG